MGLPLLVVVERWGIRQNQPFRQRQFYISSLATSAHGFAQIVQGHWSIENQLHWVKDVPLQEDAAPYKSKGAAANWSIVRTFFITFARRLGFDSISTAKRRLANQFDLVFLQLQ
jgi:predicted transposase YbfD/YdcC